MFSLNRYNVAVHLKSGQTMHLTMSGYSVKESAEGITSYRFDDLMPRCSLPVENIAAITFRRPWWARFAFWVVG